MNIKGFGKNLEKELKKELRMKQEEKRKQLGKHGYPMFHPIQRGFSDLLVVWLLLPKFSSFVSFEDLTRYSIV
jgi:hypothetical protein